MLITRQSYVTISTESDTNPFDQNIEIINEIIEVKENRSCNHNKIYISQSIVWEANKSNRVSKYRSLLTIPDISCRS